MVRGSFDMPAPLFSNSLRFQSVENLFTRQWQKLTKISQTSLSGRVKISIEIAKALPQGPKFPHLKNVLQVGPENALGPTSLKSFIFKGFY